MGHRPFFGPPSEGDRSFVCGTCHREHRGADFDLTAISNERCVTCHKAQFMSFSEGHPQYAKYPYLRRTRIQFDHISHMDKHFRDEKLSDHAPGPCWDCHELDRAGQLMLVKPFETVCVACHGGQVEGDGRSDNYAIAVIGVPRLDLVMLWDRGAAIGEWPKHAAGRITPFMDLLLSSDENYKNAKSILENLKLKELSLKKFHGADENQIAAVEKLAWSVKGLLFDLRTRGLTELKTRLKQAFERELTTVEVARLTGLLPSGLVEVAQRNWFPALMSEVPCQRDVECKILPPARDQETASEGEKSNHDIGIGDNEEIDIGDDEEIDFGDDEDIDITDDEEENDEDTDEHPSAETVIKVEIAGERKWAAAGGWYRDDNTFTLRYRPVTHADGFVRGWLDLTAPTAGSEGWAKQIFERLAGEKGPGMCVKCHYVDSVQDTGFVVNWRGMRPQPHSHSFTRYFHVPHFSLLGEKGCMTCHNLKPAAKYAGGFKDRDPTEFESNFKPLEQGVCARCHRAGKAPDSCLTCHNYHLGEFAPAVGPTVELLARHNNGEDKELPDEHARPD